jgi:hypothetical protein
MDYESAFAYRSLIQSYVEYNLMPPWTADTSFQHYFGERVLTEYERNTIIDWANDGAVEGDPDLAPPPPVYTGDQVLPGVPDLVIEMPEYMSKATELHDDYICITLPTGLTEDRKVKAIEIIPGNHSIVHHCLLYLDEDSTYPTDTTDGNCGGPSSIPLMAGYTPGASPTIFPSGDDFSSGMLMSEGSDVVFAMHYPHGSYGEYDQTRVHIYFYNEPVSDFRPILAGALLQNWEFELPADEHTTVSQSVTDLTYDLTFLSVFPHMHLLGESIESYAIGPDGDTIPFVRVPEWDFDWQDFYWFKYMQHVPPGSDIFGNGVYDNTVGNPHNPSDPPTDVYPGYNTTDEMFLVFFHLMEYQEGDEYVNGDSLNTIFLTAAEEKLPNGEISVFPNPFKDKVALNYALTEPSQVSIFIYDMQGKVVNKLYRGQQEAGEQTLEWDGTSTENASVPAGLYNYSMLINGRHYSGRIIKQ